MFTPRSMRLGMYNPIRKALIFKDGALPILAMPLALYFKILIFMIFTPQYFEDKHPIDRVLEVLSIEIEHYYIMLPFTTFAICLICYFFVTSVDFFTGLRASREEYRRRFGVTKGYVNNEQLWSSIWKVVGVMVVGTILTTFSILFALGEMVRLYNIFLFAILFFFLVVISFDIHSIGENHQRRYRKKPEFYVFVDRVADIMKEGIIEWVKRRFNMIGKEYGKTTKPEDKS